MSSNVTPTISVVITVPWVRGSILGMRFGTPVPTQVRLCYHPQHDHWLEFSDGTNADAVASRFPDEIRQARLEMMTSYSRRESITNTFHRRRSETGTKPPTATIESRPRVLREGLSQMTSTEAIRRAGGRTASAAPSEPARAAASGPTGAVSAANPFEAVDQLSDSQAPPQKGTTTSSVFAANADETTRRLNALRAARITRNTP